MNDWFAMRPHVLKALVGYYTGENHSPLDRLSSIICIGLVQLLSRLASAIKGWLLLTRICFLPALLVVAVAASPLYTVVLVIDR